MATQQELQALQNQVTALQKGKRIKLPLFHGQPKENLDLWLQKCRLMLGTAGITDEADIAAHLAGALDGAAWTWLNPETRLKFATDGKLQDLKPMIKKGTVDGHFANLKAFVDFLKQQTGDRINPENDALIKLQRIKMAGKGITVYNTEFRRLRAMLPAGVTEIVIRLAYIGGLDNWLIEKITESNVSAQNEEVDWWIKKTSELQEMKEGRNILNQGAYAPKYKDHGVPTYNPPPRDSNYYGEPMDIDAVRTGRTEGRPCYRCGEVGHFIKECPKPKEWKTPNNRGSFGRSGTNNRGNLNNRGRGFGQAGGSNRGNFNKRSSGFPNRGNRGSPPKQGSFRTRKIEDDFKKKCDICHRPLLYDHVAWSRGDESAGYTCKGHDKADKKKDF